MKIKKYLRELSVVIIGILVAFWISKVGVNIKDKATQKQVLHTILSELKDNNESIKATLQSLEVLNSSFIKIKESDSSSVTLEINYEGLSLKSIGYETAKFTGVFKDINYELTSEIVENYETQNSLEELDDLMVDELFVWIKDENSEESEIDYLLIHILNLINNIEKFDVRQKRVIKDLQEFLKIE